jgi:hypothetical protein
MSSFKQRHKLYLFQLKNGRRKLAYGPSPETALKILSYRLNPTEMEQIMATEHITINQRELGRVVAELG